MSALPQDIDYEAAYASYLQRFDQHFGDRPLGTFVKFGKHMVQKLAPDDFRTRIDAYLRLHKACEKMLRSGSTISDALVLDFAEASAWIILEAPDMHALFRGELGDPQVAAPPLRREFGPDVTDPDLPLPPGVAPRARGHDH